MEKKLMGIGTLILTKGVIAAYVKAMLDLIEGGATTEDTENIAETLGFLRSNYEGDPMVEANLSYATNLVLLAVKLGTTVNVNDDVTATLRNLQRHIEVTK